MIHQLHNFPRTKHFILACSGGADSMFAADFYVKGNKSFTLAYFNHGTPQANNMESTVRAFADKHKLKMLVGNIQREKRKDESPEEYFRNERYRWLVSMGTDIVTAHHLNDAVEGYLFSALHGNPKIMQSCTMISHYGQNATLWRPYLTNTKQQLTDWCIRHDVAWLEDESNKDTKYPRNFIRHELMLQCLRVNPGLANTIRKKILKERMNHE